MGAIKRLPDSEFEIMEIIWEGSPPMTTLQIMSKMRPDRDIKLQTLLTMLLRLVEKGFLISERVGRERSFKPIVSKHDYMHVETETFMERHYIKSIGNLITTFYQDRQLSSEDLKELNDLLADL